MDKYAQEVSRLGRFHIVKAQGGMVTVRERALLGFGEKSLVQNMRCWHPGFETRDGYDTLSTTATDAAGDSILNMYQFSKGKVGEQAVFVQYGDGDLHKQNGSIPTEYTGAFGTEVFSGASGQIPASFADVNDYMIYSNGADQHKIYPGSNQDIESVVKVVAAGAHDFLPALGEDFYDILSDDDVSTTMTVDGLGDYANDFDAIYVMAKTKVDAFEIAMAVAQTAAAEIKIDNWTGSWNNIAVTDGTDVGGDTLAQSGSITFNTTAAARTTEVPRYMFGESGYWYKIYVKSGDPTLADGTISGIKYSTTSFQDIANIWNSVETDIIEAFHYVNADTIYYNYPGDAITISGMTSSDYLYFASPYQLEAGYIDFGGTTNTTAADPVIEYWDGNSWETLTQRDDGTNEFLETGWLTWERPSDEQKLQYKNTKYFAYWYRLAVDATVDASTIISILGMPYFNVDTLGKVGRVSAAWKDRALYTFNKFPRDIYVSEVNEPLKLNGSDFAILSPGDGRDNATMAIANFYNEIMVFQEELGKEGGCVTIFEGYSPSTFGKLVLSTKLGTLSAKSVAVVDGSKTSLTNENLTTQTMVFFLSHSGVFMSDGKVITGISDDIQNYFDERFAECIRDGYENEMWLAFDSTENMIKIGIVSGASATTCNKFFCYDLTDGVWYEDVYSDSMSVFTESSADTGQFHTIQIAGGSTSGFVYRMNFGTNDNGAAIDAKMTWEFNQGPFFIGIQEILARCKVQGAATTYTWTAEENDKEIDDGTGIMSAEVTGYTMARNRHQQKIDNIAWITFSIRNNTINEKIYLYDLGIIANATEFK